MSGTDSSSSRPVVPDPEVVSDFSAQLDGAFNLGGELPGLTQTVQEKKQAIDTQNRELVELEARIKAAEAALEQAGGKVPPTTGAQQPSTGGSEGARVQLTSAAPSTTGTATGNNGVPTGVPDSQGYAQAQASSGSTRA